MSARHCAACGGLLEPFDDHGRARLRCGGCGRVHYENSKPAVGAVALRGDRVLLSLRAREPAKGLWDLPGGFLEAGEHPEDGIARELEEETGSKARVGRLLHVGVGRYGDAHTLNLVYLVELDGEPEARDDSAEMRWWPLDALPDLAFPHEAHALRLALAER